MWSTAAPLLLVWGASDSLKKTKKRTRKRKRKMKMKKKNERGIC